MKYAIKFNDLGDYIFNFITAPVMCMIRLCYLIYLNYLTVFALLRTTKFIQFQGTIHTPVKFC